MPSGLIFQLFLKERPTFSVFVLSEQTKQSLDEAPDRADSRPKEEYLHDAAARSAQIKIMYAERAEKYSEQRREIPILFAAFTRKSEIEAGSGSFCEDTGAPQCGHVVIPRSNFPLQYIQSKALHLRNNPLLTL